jgi:hypothetical protein
MMEGGILLARAELLKLSDDLDKDGDWATAAIIRDIIDQYMYRDPAQHHAPTGRQPSWEEIRHYAIQFPKASFVTIAAALGCNGTSRISYALRGVKR